eukprot:2409799-Prymnesium_polylepis.1
MRCPLCIQSLDSTAELETHIRTRHPFGCRACRVDHRDAAALRAHDVRVHHQCVVPERVAAGRVVCRCRLDSAEELREHAWEQHLVLLCTACGQTFDEVRVLTDQLAIAASIPEQGARAKAIADAEKKVAAAFRKVMDHCARRGVAGGQGRGACTGHPDDLEFVERIRETMREPPTVIPRPPPQFKLATG